MITHKVEVFKLSIQIQFKVLLPNGCQGQGSQQESGANKNQEPTRIKNVCRQISFEQNVLRRNQVYQSTDLEMNF